MITKNDTLKILGVGALLIPCSLALGEERVVPSVNYPTLPVAISAADANDTITLMSVGSPFVGTFDTGTKPLTIRGEVGQTVVLDAFGLGTVLTVGGDGTVLENLTIRGGVSGTGAGLRIIGSDTTISGCRFEDNHTTSSAGAIRQEAGAVVSIVDSVFAGNTSPTGGGLYAFGGVTNVSGCVFMNNDATGAAGGAIRTLSNHVLTVTGSRFVENTSIDFGGALSMTGGTDATVTRSWFELNESDRGGALYNSNDSRVDVDNSVFHDNTARFYGGANYNHGGAVTFLNSTVVGSSSQGVNGGGAFSLPSGTTDVTNSIVWNAEPITWSGSGTMTYHATNAKDAPLTNGNISVAPVFVDEANDDFRLASGAPGVDAGDSLAAVDSLVDYNGDTRGLDDPDTANSGVSTWAINIDMGAFEFQPSAEPDCPADLAPPFGALDVFDVLEYFGRFDAGCP